MFDIAQGLRNTTRQLYVYGPSASKVECAFPRYSIGTDEHTSIICIWA